MIEPTKAKMTIEELRSRLLELAKSDDPESAHYDSDALLLEFIDDEQVSEIFHSSTKWYA